MSEIVVRRLRFEFPVDTDLEVLPNDHRGSRSSIAFSLTMPYLEPYLIRTMRGALPRVKDRELAEDMRRFSAQESHHYRNHAKFNEQIRSKLHPEIAAKIQRIEAALEADYRRFSSERSLRFNLAYAEGFEAMTGALALSMLETGGDEVAPGYRELVEWHLAEEIEHRTVAFGAYQALVGSYLYRVWRGVWAQLHYLKYIHRFYACLMAESGRGPFLPYLPPSARSAWRGYLKTFAPDYDPAAVPVSPRLRALLDKYSALEGAGSD